MEVCVHYFTMGARSYYRNAAFRVSGTRFRDKAHAWAGLKLQRNAEDEKNTKGSRSLLIPMPFDTSIISPWHLAALLGVFIGVYAIIAMIVRMRPVSWRVYSTGKPLYYAGWIAALCITAAASFVLEDRNLLCGLLGSVCI